MSEVLFVKNMVCDRCVKAVNSTLIDLDIDGNVVRLGEIELSKPLSNSQRSRLTKALSEQGFEVLEDRNKQIIERIKVIVISHVRDEDHNLMKNLSAIISEDIGRDYANLSTLFSSFEGITIEKYTILQKVEYVKELIAYNEMNLSELYLTFL